MGLYERLKRGVRKESAGDRPRRRLDLEPLEPRILLSAWSGVIPDGTTWGSTPGEVETITGDCTVEEGSTLTILAGAVVKFSDNASLYVDGTVNASGSSADPIYLTSLVDDSVGGDTNGDGGATTPGAGDWDNIVLLLGDTAVLNMQHAFVRYAGYTSSYLAAICVRSGQLTLSDVQISDATRTGVLVSGGTGSHTLTNVTVSDVGRAGVDLSSSGPTMTTSGLSVHNTGTTALVAADAGKWNSSNTTLSGAGVLALKLEGGNITDARSWDDDVVYYLDGTVTVDEGATLTIPSGQIVKADTDGSLQIQGMLNAQGTSGSHVVFSSLYDDTAGGGHQRRWGRHDARRRRLEKGLD